MLDPSISINTSPRNRPLSSGVVPRRIGPLLHLVLAWQPRVPRVLHGLAGIPTQTVNVAGKGGEPRPDKHTALCGNDRIDHAVVHAVEVSQCFGIVIQEADRVSKVTGQRFVDSPVRVVGGNVDGLSWLHDLLCVVVPFFHGQPCHLVLKVSTANMVGGERPKLLLESMDDLTGRTVQVILVVQVVPDETLVEVVVDGVGKVHETVEMVEEAVLKVF